MRPLGWCARAALLIFLPTSVATADVAPRAIGCPVGSAPHGTHAGSRCLLAPCERDQDCFFEQDSGRFRWEEMPGQHACRPQRVCVRPSRVAEDAAAEAVEEQQLLISCAPDEDCGPGGDVAPTVGTAAGEVRCEVQSVCVPIPDLDPFGGAAVEPARPAIRESAACGCRVIGARQGLAPVLLGLAVLFARARRR